MANSYDWDVEASVQDAALRLTLSSDNLFNVHPPFLNSRIAAIGYDQENADLWEEGRFFYKSYGGAKTLDPGRGAVSR